MSIKTIFNYIFNYCKYNKPKEYFVNEGFTIILKDKRDMDLRRDKLDGKCYQKSRVIVCNYSGKVDINGNPLPDFGTLSHELWHFFELGGSFHK